MKNEFSSSIFFALCNKYMDFLFSEYSCQILETTVVGNADYGISIGNNIFIVSVEYETRGSEVIIAICQNINGKTPKGMAFDKYCVPINIIIKKHSLPHKLPSRGIFTFKPVVKHVEEYLSISSDVLRYYATDLLNGGFGDYL